MSFQDKPCKLFCKPLDKNIYYDFMTKRILIKNDFNLIFLILNFSINQLKMAQSVGQTQTTYALMDFVMYHSNKDYSFYLKLCKIISIQNIIKEYRL